jgi:hypothetical protein
MSILAYVLLVVGVPMYVGALAGLATAPLAWSFSDAKKRTVLDALKILQGIVAIGAALLLFRVCAVRPVLAVLVISVIWITLYHYLFKQPLISWVMWVIGLLLGWFVCFSWFRP